MFITHHINEALEIGDRILVFHRLARIAYEARLDADGREEQRKGVEEKILEVLSIEKAGE